jgi:4-amino-4-deoxy-L-arabinose transferase-like glycosyltransferase
VLSLRDRRAQVALAALFTALCFAWRAPERFDEPLDEIDEAAVVASASYFDLAFRRGELRSPDWQAPDALDHPPLWKYIHGAALALAGWPIGPLAAKDAWAARSWETGARGEAFREELRALYPAPMLQPGRLVSTLCLAAAAMLVFGLGAQLFSPFGRDRGGFTGWAALVFFALNANVRWVASRALIDGILVLLVVGATWAQLRWLRRGPATGRIAPGSAIGAGALLGMAALTKITGVLGLAGAAVALAATPGALRGRRAQASFALLALTALAVALLLDPSLWDAPLSFLAAMVRRRATVLETQQLLFRSALPTPWAGLSAFLERVLLRPDPVQQAIGLPVVLAAFAVGVVRLGEAPAAFWANALLWTAGTALGYRMDWPRYVLPALPFVALIAARGLETLVFGGPALLRRQWGGALAVALALGLLIVGPRVAARYEDPRRPLERRIALADALLASPPESTAPAALLRDKRAEAEAALRALDVQR